MHERETAKDYEHRTWRERAHANPDGTTFIPGVAFKNCLSDAAKYLSIQIPGKGKATYTKHIEAGVMVLENLPLPVKKDEMEGEWLFVPSDGKRGGPRRVSKCFPVFREWGGTVEFSIFDDAITEPIFTKHITEAGKFIGIGRYRPRNNGVYGRFAVDKVDWT
jgi:hypothetical protein